LEIKVLFLIKLSYCNKDTVKLKSSNSEESKQEKRIFCAKVKG